MQLVAYYPFAFSVVSPSVAWNQNGAIINNSGDLPANIEIVYDLDTIDGDILVELRLDGSNDDIAQLKLSGIEKVAGDKYLSINTQTQLIEGLDANK